MGCLFAQFAIPLQVILAALFDTGRWGATHVQQDRMPGIPLRVRCGCARGSVRQELTMLGLRKERNSPCAAG